MSLDPALLLGHAPQVAPVRGLCSFISELSVWQKSFGVSLAVSTVASIFLHGFKHENAAIASAVVAAVSLGSMVFRCCRALYNEATDQDSPFNDAESVEMSPPPSPANV